MIGTEYCKSLYHLSEIESPQVAWSLPKLPEVAIVFLANFALVT